MAQEYEVYLNILEYCLDFEGFWDDVVLLKGNMKRNLEYECDLDLNIVFPW